MDLGRQMRAIGGLNGTHIHEPFEQLLVCLTGQSDTPASLNGAHFQEAEALALAEATGTGSSICVHRTAMGVARYLCGDAKEASESLEIARGSLAFAPSCWLRVFCHQFAVLAGCASWPQLNEDERLALRPKLEESADELRSMASHSPFNFEHRVSLVEGALKRVDGDVEGARTSLQAALERAVEHDWLCEVALAHELLGALGDDEQAAKHRGAARDAYLAWGAPAVRSALL